MTTTFQAEFRAAPGGQRYPFSDSSSLTAQTGFSLPPALVVDAAFWVAGTEVVRLTSLVIDNNLVSWVFAAGTQEIGSGELDLTTPVAVVDIVSPAGHAVGLIVLDTAQVIHLQTWPPGTHTFADRVAELAVTCCTPLPEVGLGAINVDSTLLIGDIWLVGEHGVTLEVIDNRVKIHVVGDPLAVRKLCGTEDVFQPPRFIRSINAATPDQHGNVMLDVIDASTEDTILRIDRDAEGLTILAVGRNNTT